MFRDRFLAAGLIFFLFLLASTPQLAEAKDQVRVCDDIVPWPPFTYPSSASTVQGHGQTGAMVEFLDALMKEIGVEYALKLRPWKRCLKEASGPPGPGRFEVVINANSSAERAKAFHISDAVYRTTPGAFYTLDQFPSAPPIRSSKDLQRYEICGVRGYTYQNFGLEDSMVTIRAKSLKLALKMLEKGRCQIVLNSIEPILGTKLFGDSIVPSNVRVAPLSSDLAATFHILVSKDSPRGKWLVDQINEAISNLTNDGTRDRIFGKFRRLLKSN